MSVKPNKEGKLEVNIQGKWKKRYVMTTATGDMYVSDSKKSKKTAVMLTNTTEVARLPTEKANGKDLYSFIISTPGKSTFPVVIRTPDKNIAGEWMKQTKLIVQQKQRESMKKRPDLNSYYANTQLQKKDSHLNLGMRGTGGGGRRNQLVPDTEGWEMCVGKKKGSPNYFVSARTWEYFNSIEDCRAGKAPVGKALLSLLV